MKETPLLIRVWAGVLGVWLLWRSVENFRSGVATIKPFRLVGYRYQASRLEKPFRYWSIIVTKAGIGFFMIYAAAMLETYA